MSSVDDRVVQMGFSNSAFERGVAATLRTLDKLKNALKFSGASSGLSDLESKASRFNMNGMANAADHVKKKFDIMRIVAVTAIATIAHRAVNMGINLVKAFTINPIMAGFHNYETQINAIQTILANTGLKGAAGLKQVNGVLAELNTYANKTVYNFSEMAKNIGTFTAAGVKLKPAAQAIKGIANLAAFSGSNSQQASTAMYQLSQAIAANQVKLQDWNSVVNAGIGGKAFQERLFETGKTLGTLKGVPMGQTFDQWTKAGNSFRMSLQSGWITGKVLTQTLAGFTGDLTSAQLKSMGYNAQQIKQIQQMGKTAVDAATKIKTITQLQEALKEEVATAYGAIFKTIFGNINQAKTLFSAIHTSVENALTIPIYHFNTLLEGAVKLGARKNVLDGFKNALHAIGAVLKPIGQAFHEVFPPQTARDFYNISVSFLNFTKNLKIGADTANNLKRTFAGVFAVLDIGKQIVSGIFHAFATLLGVLFKGSGGFLNLTGSVGDFLVSLDKTLKKSHGIANFFTTLGGILSVPIRLLGILGTVLGNLFNGFNPHEPQALKNSIGGIGSSLAALPGIGAHVTAFFSKLWDNIRPGVNAILKAIGGIGQSLAQVFAGANVNTVLHLLSTGLLAGIAVMIKKFFAKGLSVNIGGGVFNSIKEAFGGVTENLKAMQQEVKAKTILEIAAAMALLTASIVALSTINGQKLSRSLKFLAIGFGELLGAMKILTSISGSAGFLKVPVIAFSMNLLATAILLLTVAVYALSRLSWQQLEKGLTAVGVLLGIISAASLVLTKNSAGLIRAGIGILVLSVALNALYLAVANFAKLDWGQMLKGLVGVAGSLGAIAVAMHLMPKGMLIQAAALVAISGALNLIARALAKMGGMSWSELAKGLIALGGAFAILVVGLNALDGAVAGAAALTLVAFGLKLLVGVLVALAGMSIGDLVKSMVALAAAIGVIALAAVAVTPAIPEMLALGAAMVLVGGGMALFGLGAIAVAKAMEILAKTGGAAISAILNLLKGVIGLLPTLGKNLALGLTNFIVVIGQNAPKIIGAFVKLLGGLLDAIPPLVPKLVKAIGALLQGLFQVIEKNIPGLVKAGISIILALLRGISKNIGKVVGLVADILVKFLNAVASHLGSIIAAGVRVLVRFLEGIAKGISKVIRAGTDIIIHLVTGITNALGRIIAAGTNAMVHFLTGVANSLPRIIRAGTTVIIKFIEAIGNNALRLARAGARTLLQFINGLTAAVNEYAPQLREAGIHLAEALMDGLTFGIASKVGHVLSTIGGVAHSIVGTVGGILHINSPSKVFIGIGSSIGEGMVIGINQQHKKVVDSAADMGNHTIRIMKDTLSNLSSSIVGNINVQPTVTPIIDLSEVRKGASQMSGIIDSSKISPKISIGQASSISQATTTAKDAANTDTSAAAVKTFEFKQYNTSPKALSTAEIYRNTRNQISRARLELGLPASTS